MINAAMSKVAEGVKAMVSSLKGIPGDLASGLGDIAAAFPRSAKVAQSAAKATAGAASGAATWAKQQGQKAYNAARQFGAGNPRNPPPPPPPNPNPPPNPPNPNPPPNPPPPGPNSPPAGNNPSNPRRLANPRNQQSVNQSLGTVLSQIRALAAGGAIVGLIRGTAQAYYTISTLPKKLKDFGESVLESQRHLSHWNAGINNSFAVLDAERLGRNIKLANATSGSASGLAKSQSKLEESLLPVQIRANNLLNNILAAIEEKSAELIATTLAAKNNVAYWFGAIAPALGKIFTEVEKMSRSKDDINADQSKAVWEQVQRIADEMKNRKAPPPKGK